MPLYMVLYSKVFLEGRTFRVQGDHIWEEIWELKTGVPQGTHSGPALYYLYTAEKTKNILKYDETKTPFKDIFECLL